MKEFIEKLIGRLEERIQMNVGWEDDEYWQGETSAYEDAIEIVNQLAEEYNNGWIPCSERLPDSDVDVNITTRSSIVGVGSFFEKTNEWVQWYCGGGIVVDVIAWQPLPAPYQPKGE